MKNLLTWLKTRFQDRPKPATESLSAVIRQQNSLIASYREEVSALKSRLRTPFHARESENAPPWDNDDAQRLKAFLDSPAGEKLRRVLNWWSCAQEQQATVVTTLHEYACGKAAGFRDCGVFVIQKLSAEVRPEQDPNTPARDGAAAARERFAP